MATVLTVQPHQDDAALAFAAMIDQHQRNGHRVIVLTMTNGLGSGAQASVGLDDAAFTAARDDEDKRALRRLGVRYEDIRISTPRGRGGELTPTGVALALAGFIATELATVPKADLWVKAYTPLEFPGSHADHRATGAAVDILEAEGIITAPRYYVEPWPDLLAAFKDAHPTVKLSAQRPTVLGLPRVQAAFDEYCREDHAAGEYGIGGVYSVPRLFKALRPDPVNYWHMPVPFPS